MAIIRWDPFRDLVTLREKMNRLFEDFYPAQGEEKNLVSSSWTPSVDICETEGDLILNAELPGITDKDLQIKIEDNILSLKGERKFEKETKKENYHRVERSYGSFCRSFTIPTYVDQEKIEAEHEHGILKITLPKKHESKPRSIKVLKSKVKTEKKEKN